ncbi:MAG: DJ-1/PfpI family protein [Candidatus Diapherotrites archaeon]|nr:DJ-1/PfpI family protein [Candidatus Diapherotrites archaeon]
MKKVLFVIAKNNFRDEEFFVTRRELEKYVTAFTASTEKGECIGSKGGKEEADYSLNGIDSEEFEGIIFVGGSGAHQLFNNPSALSLAKEFYSAGKVTAAICIAPTILANAGILRGIEVTSFPSEQKWLTSKGAKFIGGNVVVSGKIITASGPEAAKEFGEAIAEALR